MIEKIMDDYDRAYGLKSVRLRYFNVAGADSSKRVGEWHNPETHLIPNILKSVYEENKSFEIYGTDYDTKDGTCIRDYINIEDLIDAHLLALEYLNNGGNTNFFNLGTKEGNSVKEVFDIIGSFDESVTAGEIIDWQNKMDKNNLKIKKIDFISTYRRLHSTNFGKTQQKTEFKDYAALLRARIGR